MNIQQKIMQAIVQKFPKGFTCNVCNDEKREFEIITALAAIPLIVQSLIVGGKQQMLPAIPVVCKNCGNIRFFSSNVLGVTGKQAANEQVQEEKRIIVDPNQN